MSPSGLEVTHPLFNSSKRTSFNESNRKLDFVASVLLRTGSVDCLDVREDLARDVDYRICKGYLWQPRRWFDRWDARLCAKSSGGNQENRPISRLFSSYRRCWSAKTSIVPYNYQIFTMRLHIIQRPNLSDEADIKKFFIIFVFGGSLCIDFISILGR